MSQIINRLSKVKFQLSKISEYMLKTNRNITHFQLRFDCNTNDCFIAAKYSNRVEKSELNSASVSSLEYMSKNLLATYLQMYVFTNLTSIIIECDIDEIGIVTETLKVRCKFKRNSWGRENSDVILDKIIRDTVEAENDQIPEIGATRISFRLLRGRLRSISVITDFKYAVTDIKDSRFDPKVTTFFKKLISDYENRNNSLLSKVSGKIDFGITNRDRVIIAKSILYSGQKIRIAKKEESELNEADISKNIEHFKQWIPYLPDVVLDSITMTRKGAQAGLSLQFKNYEQGIDNTNLLDTYDWNELLGNIILLYSVDELSSDWSQKAKVSVTSNSEYIRTDLVEAYVEYAGPRIEFGDYPYLIKAIDQRFKNENAKIWKIVMSKNEEDLSILKIYFTAKQVPPTPSNFAMQLVTPNQEDDSVIRTFEISKQGYILVQEELLVE